MTDWQDKYSKLSAQMQQDDEERAESEQLLLRAIARMTIAFRGLDKQLDPHLKSLQTAAKGGKATPAFQHRLGELTDALIKAREDKKQADDHKEGGLERLVASSLISNKARSQLQKKVAELSADPQGISDEQVDGIIRLLADSIESDAESATQETKSGMLGRLLGGGRKEKGQGEKSVPMMSPNQLLLELMQRLPWPSRLSDEILRLSERLKAESEKENAWLKVIEEITRLYSGVLGAAEEDLSDTENYLGQLNLRLKELDSVIQQMDHYTTNSLAGQAQLRHSLDGELGGMRQDVREAGDLDSFKHLLDRRLDAIQNQVENHLRNEEAHLNAVTQEAEKLRERLGDLEANGEKLLQRLEEIQAQALTDPLTKLPNRGAYEQRVIEEFARWQRFGKPLSMLVWDIDHFKRINDTFGHQVGDKVLQAIGKLLSERIRATDFVARYGGEEFVMLMPGSNAEQAGQVANEIRQGIASKSFRAGAKELPITISCGYATVGESDDPEQVFKRADEALYLAKEKGRNCCELGA